MYYFLEVLYHDSMSIRDMNNDKYKSTLKI